MFKNLGERPTMINVTNFEAPKVEKLYSPTHYRYQQKVNESQGVVPAPGSSFNPQVVTTQK